MLDDIGKLNYVTDEGRVIKDDLFAQFDNKVTSMFEDQYFWANDEKTEIDAAIDQFERQF